MKHWNHICYQWRKSLAQATMHEKLFALLLVLGLCALVAEGWNSASSSWTKFQRPKVEYTRSIPNGIAVSLNGLKQSNGKHAALPRMRIRGVSWYQQHWDWATIGAADPERSPLPADVITFA